MKTPERTMIYIGQEKHIVTQAVENRLTEAGFRVIAIPSDIDAINKNRHNTDIFLCYLDYTSAGQEDGQLSMGGAYLCTPAGHERRRRRPHRAGGRAR